MALFLRIQNNLRGVRIVSKQLFRIASDLGMCDLNRITHRGGIARFGPLGSGLSFIVVGGVSSFP